MTDAGRELSHDREEQLAHIVREERTFTRILAAGVAALAVCIAIGLPFSIRASSSADDAASAAAETGELLEDALDQIQEERETRIAEYASRIGKACRVDEREELILKRLVDASLATGGLEEPLESQFERASQRLGNLRDCRAEVLDYLYPQRSVAEPPRFSLPSLPTD